MLTPEELQQTHIIKAAIAPLIASSLLNATYSRLIWSKAFDTDQKTFDQAYEIVVKQTLAIHKKVLEDVFGLKEDQYSIKGLGLRPMSVTRTMLSG